MYVAYVPVYIIGVMSYTCILL